MNPESEESTGEDITGIKHDFIPRAYVANHEALGWLENLDALAKEGNPDAIREFYCTACSMVARLNELHLDYAGSVLEWPILLPQNREERNAITKLANEMRIGSVKAGGKGQPEKLGYDSEKGFAIKNLQRIALARALLRPLKPAFADMDGNPIKSPSPAETVMHDAEVFREAVGIGEFDCDLLEIIGGLPEYRKDSKEEWIAVVLKVLDQNPDLVPESFAIRAVTVSSERLANGKTRMVRDERGGVLKRALVDGLRNVSAIPGMLRD